MWAAWTGQNTDSLRGWRYETITPARHSLDIPGRSRVIVESRPDSSNGGIDAVLRAALARVVPKRGGDLLARNQLALAVDQEDQKVQRLLRETESFTVAREPVIACIQLEVSESDRHAGKR